MVHVGTILLDRVVNLIDYGVYEDRPPGDQTPYLLTDLPLDFLDANA